VNYLPVAVRVVVVIAELLVPVLLLLIRLLLLVCRRCQDSLGQRDLLFRSLERCLTLAGTPYRLGQLLELAVCDGRDPTFFQRVLEKKKLWRVIEREVPSLMSRYQDQLVPLDYAGG
jgi:hypothetical protein